MRILGRERGDLISQISEGSGELGISDLRFQRGAGNWRISDLRFQRRAGN